MPTLVGAALRAARALRIARRPGSPDGRNRTGGPALPVGRDPDGLTRWQADHAGFRLAALRPSDQDPVQRALWAARPDVRPHLRRALAAGHPADRLLDLADRLGRSSPRWVAQRLTLLDDRTVEQRRLGARIDQVDQRTCGTTVLLVLAAQADPVRALELTAPGHDETGRRFPDRFDRLQITVHRQSARLWPRALGTSPWGMTRWLRRHADGSGPYRVRLVDDSDPRDLAAVLAAVDAALGLGDPVPLLVGSALPRHYVLALGGTALAGNGGGGTALGGGGWRVFEPTAGVVRTVPGEAVTGRRLGPLLGFDRLHAVLLPS